MTLSIILCVSYSRDHIFYELQIYEDILEHLKPQFMRTNGQLKSFKPISERPQEEEKEEQEIQEEEEI